MKPFGPEVCQSVWQSSRLQFRIQHVIRVALTFFFLLPPVLPAQANQSDFSRKVITRQVSEYPSVARFARLAQEESQKWQVSLPGDAGVPWRPIVEAI